MAPLAKPLAVLLLLVSSGAVAQQPKVTELTGRIQLDHVILVKVTNLKDWMGTNDPRKLVPFLNGRAILGLFPEAILEGSDVLEFHLERTEENREVWADLLREPVLQRPVTFSVGLSGQVAFDTVYGDDNRLRLIIVPSTPGVLAFLLVLLLVILFAVLARRTNIIRDPGPSPVPGQQQPYNLARAQMAFWFFLVFTAWIVLWLITGDVDTIPASVLGLLSIASGTAVSDAFIDSSKDVSAKKEEQNLMAEKQALESNPAAPDPQRMAQVNAKLAAVRPAPGDSTSLSFLRDILQDSDGYSFHRFQIFAWTLVLGIVFIASVYEHLSMPEFNATLLGLMGISAGTYLGLKIPEK